jgi:hypothetical protein
MILIHPTELLLELSDIDSSIERKWNNNASVSFDARSREVEMRIAEERHKISNQLIFWKHQLMQINFLLSLFEIQKMPYHHTLQFLVNSVVFDFQKINIFNYVTQLPFSVLGYQRKLPLSHILFVYQDLFLGGKL